MATFSERIAHHKTELVKAQDRVKDIQLTIQLLEKEQKAIDKPKPKPKVKAKPKAKAAPAPAAVTTRRTKKSGR